MKQKTGRSFINAFSGLRHFFWHESNGRIQSVIALCTVLLAVFFHIRFAEWIVILLCIGSVLALEMFNSALEKLCDLVQPDFHPQIKVIKDVAAGAVLWASIISAIIGVLIFLPVLLTYL